jgi:PAS domain-containing protein
MSVLGVGAGGAHSLPLIVAREFASNVAVPVFLVDANNELVYYNEAAQIAFGTPFAQPGALRQGDWSERFRPAHPDGSDFPREQLPVVVALENHQPAHGSMQVTAPDGNRVNVEITAIPLWSSPEEFAGVMAIGWMV